MNADTLWSSILQAAIQGKLVLQDLNDGLASSLFDVSSILKVEDYSSFDIPFSIPNNWSFVFLGGITDFKGNVSVLSEIIPDDAYVLELDNIEKDTGRIIGTTNPRKLNKGSTQHVFKKGCVLYSKLRPYLNKVVIPDRDGYCSTEIIPLYFAKGIDLQYIQIVLMSPYFVNFTMDNVYGAKMPRLNLKKGAEFLVPVPPLAEQRRIVAKLEELKPLVERYGRYQTRLSELNASIGPLLKKSILQAAIQGKLVSQDPDEEHSNLLLERIEREKNTLIKTGEIKRDKNTSRIYHKDDQWFEESSTGTTELNVPFEIPSSWSFERFGNIVKNRDSERIPLSSSDRSHLSKVYDYYGASGVIDKVDKYLFDTPLLLIGEDGANLLTRSKPIAFIAKGRYWVNNHAHVLDMYSGMNMEYLCLFINAIDLFDYVTGTAQPKMNQEKMNSILVAIPPVAEQQRIVDAIASIESKLVRLGEC